MNETELREQLHAALERVTPPADMHDRAMLRQRPSTWSMRRRGLLGVAVLLAVALIVGLSVIARGSHQRVRVAESGTGAVSTASISPGTMIPASALQDMRVALRAWATFPVNASPRPLVLTADPVSPPALGFRTDEAKEAFLSGVFAAPATLPPGPQHAAGYPIVTAAQALAVLRAEGTPAAGAPSPPAPLVITSARFGTSSFGTDRGTRLLPAWLFSFLGVQNPAAVLAIAPSSRFPAPAASLGPATVGAQLDSDGRTATIRFAGAAPGRGPCTADYTVDQLASDTAVAIRVRETGHRGGTCRSMAYARREEIVLGSPLGERVLVDATTKAPVAIAP